MDEHEADALLSFAREGDRELRGLQAGAWRGRLQDRTPQLEAAFRWFLDHDRAGDSMAMAIALANFVRISGRVTAGREWLDRALAAASPDDPQRPFALYENGLLAFWQGADEEVRSLLEQSLDLGRRRGDATAVAVALCGLARLVLREGDLDRARALCEEALEAVEGTDDTVGRSNALHVLGVIAQMRGDLEQAREVMSRRIELARTLGNFATVGGESSNLSMVERQLGNLERAEQLAAEALQIQEQRGDEWAVPYSLNGLAAVAVETGAFERAATLLGAAEALQARQGNDWPPDERPHFEHSRTVVTGALDPAQRQRAWSAGEAMSLADAVGYALARSGLEQ